MSSRKIYSRRTSLYLMGARAYNAAYVFDVSLRDVRMSYGRMVSAFAGVGFSALASAAILPVGLNDFFQRR